MAGKVLHYDLPAHFGKIFTEMMPAANPITTLAAAKGVSPLEHKVYSQVEHTNFEASALSDVNLKPDNASVSLGSTSFESGSNTAQVFFEGFGQSWARKGDQRAAKVQDWGALGNPSVEPDTLGRGRVEAIGRIKSMMEFVGREGVYNVPHGGTASGTTGTWSQRGIKNAPGLTLGTGDGGTIASGTLGTLGTLTKTDLVNNLQTIWESRLWNAGTPIIALCNATVKRALTELMVAEFNFGKNGVSTTFAGVDLLQFMTDFGMMNIVLSHNVPTHDLYLLNYDYINMVVRPVPGEGGMFEKKLPESTAGETYGIYTEMGLNYTTGSAHGRMGAIGSTVVGGQDLS